MKYRLTTEDWLKLNYYLLETKKSEKIKLLFFRISVMVVLGVVLFMVAGETANAWGVFLYLIFFIPLWLFLGRLYKWLIKVRLIQSLKKNPMYLSERMVTIEGEWLKSESMGVIQSVPLDNVKNVIHDGDLIYLECTDGFRIVPNRVFESERNKADFLDALRSK